MEKKRYYTYMSGRIKLKTGLDEKYPLQGRVIMTEGSVIEKGDNGQMNLRLSPFLEIDEIIFVPDLLHKAKETLNVCIKNLPEYLCGQITSNIYSLNEGEDIPSEGAKKQGEFSYELYLQLKQWDSEAGYFIGRVVSRKDFDKHLSTNTLSNVKYDIEDLVFVNWSSYGAGSPHEWCRTAIEKGLELIEWQGHPMGDCIFMLFKHNNKELPPFPKRDFIDGGEEIYHKIRDEQSIRKCFPEYVKN